MKSYTINNTEIFLTQDLIEKSKSDFIINWAYKDLRSGPKKFLVLHKEAGPDLFNGTIDFEEYVKETDCFTTNSGMLECKLVLHSVVPMIHKKTYLKSFFNIGEVIKTYKKKNIARSLSLYIPEEYELCLAGIQTFLTEIELKEIFIHCENESQINKIESFFDKNIKKKSFLEKLEIKLWELMYIIGKK